MPYNFVWGGLNGRWKMPITIFQQRFQQPLFTMRRKWALNYLQGKQPEQLQSTKSSWYRGTVVDHWQSWTLVTSTLWSVWSVKDSLRTTATRWDMLFSFSTVLSLLSQHLAYIQTLPTTSPGSKSRSKENFCSIIIAIFFINVIIIIEQVKENGGMASCSGLLGSPPSLGRIDFGKSDQSQKKVFLGKYHIFDSEKGRSR